MSLIWHNPVAGLETSQEAKLAPFADPRAIDFCDAFAKLLFAHAQVKAFPDLIALAYWLRRANITRMLADYQALALRPLGQVYHVAPGNVDSLFVYSGVISLLCGNMNWIRLSSKQAIDRQVDEQIDKQQALSSTSVLIDVLSQLASSHPEVSARFQVFSCKRNDPQAQKLQQQIDGRLLWGSNEGIQALRQVPMPAHAREFIFANKHSAALIQASNWLAANDTEKQTALQLFRRDAMTFGQQACSSAKAIVWQGTDTQIEQAQADFWQRFDQQYQSDQEEVDKKESGVIVGQAGYYLMTDSEQYRALNQAQLIVMSGLATEYQAQVGAVRAQAHALSDALFTEHAGGGLFIETRITDLEELYPQLSPSFQTLSYWGYAETELQTWLQGCLVGIDRLVPLGEALQFTPVWDGVDLIKGLSRQAP